MKNAIGRTISPRFGFAPTVSKVRTCRSVINAAFVQWKNSRKIGSAAYFDLPPTNARNLNPRNE